MTRPKSTERIQEDAIRTHREEMHNAQPRFSRIRMGEEALRHLREHASGEVDHDHHPDFPHGAFTMRNE